MCTVHEVRRALPLLVVVACHSAPPPQDVVTGREWWAASCDSAARPYVPPRQRPLGLAERDSLVRDAHAHRAAWRARHIMDYRLRVAVGCFCPWPSTPAVIDVRGGVVVALRDTSGRSAGPPREPWSAYTVEGMFDLIEHAVEKDDILDVSYDACLNYPTAIRGDGKVGQVDDWFWVKAGPVTRRPR